MEIKKLRLHTPSLLAVTRVGVPAGLNSMVFTVSNMLLQSSLNTFGSIAVAGKTAALDISTLAYQGIGASYLASISFSGQCYGARDYKRIDQLLVKGTGICWVYVVAVAGVCTIFPRQMLGLFNSDPEVINMGINLLLLNVWGYVIYTISELALGCARGMGRSAIPSLLNFLGICVPRIVWILFFFPMRRDVTFLYLCYPISWTISALLQLIYYIHIRKSLAKA